MNTDPRLLVAEYYTNRLRERGPTARGVDWNSSESQELRFRQLLNICRSPKWSIGDYGCGYGSLLTVLRQNGHQGPFRGYDIAPAMIEAARTLHGADARATFSIDEASLRDVDVVVASGVFNVKASVPEVDWAEYCWETIRRLAALGKRGFAFNALTSWSDRERMRPDLFYPDPAEWFNRCKREFSRHVALLHDYGLYEFTILVRYDP